MPASTIRLRPARPIHLAVAITIAATALLWAFAGSAAARSFSIDEISVDAVVQVDGSMLVTERVTYTFVDADSQPFTVASRTFQPNAHPGFVTEIAAFEDGQPLTTVASTPTLFEWDIAPARSGTRTFELRYRVRDAVVVWSDIAEFNWKWIGTDSPAVERWSATIQLPTGPGTVRAWAHGPLDGEVTIEGDIVRAFVDNVPARRFVDTRIITPPERFTAPSLTEPALDRILSEEAANAEEANRQRERAARNERLRQDVERGLNIAMAPLVLLGFAGFLSIWHRWGRDPKRPDDIGDYWREVPDDPPAVASALVRWRNVNSDAFSATILDLARRGHFEIEEIQVDRFLLSDRTTYRFTRKDSTESGPLKAFERRTMRWVFSRDATTVTQDELIAQAKSDTERASKFWKGFTKEVNAELDRREYIDGGKAAPYALHALVVGVLAVVAGIALAVGAVIAGVAGLVAAAVLAPLGVLHRSRTPEGTRRHAQWVALRQYLNDFSRLDEAPVGHLAIWDHYLVAATALGVADELLEGLRTRFPEVLESGSVARWYHPATGSSGLVGLGSFGQSFGSQAVSSFTPSSSGSGAGGGFSSGGGGGGGGGGFGAR